MSKITLRQTGETLALTIPTETIERLGLKAGQELSLVELDDGFKVVSAKTKLERQTALAYDVLREQAATLQALARL